MFEATGNTGVGLLRWETFMKKKWNTLYEKLVLRRLEVDRTDELIKDLEKFIKAW